MPKSLDSLSDEEKKDLHERNDGITLVGMVGALAITSTVFAWDDARQETCESLRNGTSMVHPSNVIFNGPVLNRDGSLYEGVGVDNEITMCQSYRGIDAIKISQSQAAKSILASVADGAKIDPRLVDDAKRIAAQ